MLTLVYVIFNYKYGSRVSFSRDINRNNGNTIVIHSLIPKLLQRAHFQCLPNALKRAHTLFQIYKKTNPRLDPRSATEICVTDATMQYEVHGVFVNL